MFCFGPHASTAPAESMARAPQVDGMLVGEPEEGIAQIAALDTLDRLGEVANLTWRHGDTVVPHRAHGTFAGFLQAPPPAWDLLALSDYALPMVNKPYVLVETSRGCPYSCDFCVAPIHQGHKFRERSAKALVDEIERCHRTLGIDFFYLWGDTVTLNVKSFTAFCDELIARNLPIQWFGNARADNLTDPAFVHRLKRAGCWMLALGIESESEEVRKDMAKRLERQKIQTAFKNMRDAGVKSFAFFIFGYPGESAASLDATTRYAIELDPDFANFYPAVPYPGTALYDKCIRDGWLQEADADWTKMEYSVLPAARQRPRRARRHGRDQPCQAPLLPAAVVHLAPPRRRRAAGAHQAGDRVAGAVADPVRRQSRRDRGRPPSAQLARRNAAVTLPQRRLRAHEPPQVAQLLQVAGRFLEVHLALARSPPLEDVGDFGDRDGPAANQQLEADLEAAGRDADAAGEVAANQEEPGGRVLYRRQRTGEDAGEARQHQPAERPVAGTAAGNVTAADDDVGRLAVHDVEHPWQQRRRVAQVGVDDADDGGFRRLEALDDGGAEPELAAAVNHLHSMAPRQFIGERAGAVRRIVVDDDQLGVEAGAPVGVENRGDEIAEAIAFVVSGNDNRKRSRLRRIGGQRMRLPRTIIQPTLDE